MRSTATIAAAAIAVGMIWFGVVRPTRIDEAKQRALATTLAAAANPGSFASRQLARRALNRVEPLLDAFDADAELKLIAAANKYLVKDLEGAITTYRAAAAIEGRPEIFTYLGTMELMAGRREEAIRSFAKAVAFAPSYRDRPEIQPVRREVIAAAEAIRGSAF